MRTVRKLAAVLAIMAIGVAWSEPAPALQRRPVTASAAAGGDLGPELTEYMTFIDAELAELTHLYEVGEVPLPDFRLSRDRLEATREAAVRIARERDEDHVPDLYVLVDKELTQILPKGAAAIRGKKAGDRIGEDFIFHGRIRRSHSFNILERTGSIRRATPY